MTDNRWDLHYTKEKSELVYPDENLVRLLKKRLSGQPHSSIIAVDLGCGSGRHLGLLNDLSVAHAIGLDSSTHALRLAQKRFPRRLVRADISGLPLKDSAADIAIAWGSLHYGEKERLPALLGEIMRILAPGGHLFATLRSSRDTYLKKGRHLGNDVWVTSLDDLDGSIVSFYTEDELVRSMSKFGKVEYGLIERTLVGDIGVVISHWVVHAVK
jgi:SAM-dependent methyltransferase